MSAIATTLPLVRQPTNKWLVTVSITFGTLMGTIDASIVNVALPHIRGSVGATLQEITWITTGYVVAQVMVMPLTAFLGRLFGQKRVYMVCLGIFIGGSVLCGVANSLPVLVLFRFLQGLGGGALQPTEQAILRQTFPPEEQGMAMALFGMAVMIGPAFGPTLGGYIVDNFSWPWIFYINVPVGLLGLTMVASFVEEPDDIRQANRELAREQRAHMDWAGIALLCVGLAALQYVLEEGQRDDWFESTRITALAVVAGIVLTAFVIRELTARVPAVNLALFRDPVFASGTLISGLMFAVLMVSMFLLPVFMQELLGFTAVDAGLALMPRTLIMMLVTPFVGRIYGKVDPRLLIAIGIGCIAVGAVQMSHFTLETTQSGIIFAILIQGVGFGFLFPPITTVSLMTIPRPRLTDATGMSSLVRQVGGSIGLAVAATFLARFATVSKAGLSVHVTELRPEVVQRLGAIEHGMMARGFDASSAHRLAIGALEGIVSRQAFVIAFERIFFLTGILFLCALPMLLLMRLPKTMPRAAKPAHVEMDV